MWFVIFSLKIKKYSYINQTYNLLTCILNPIVQNVFSCNERFNVDRTKLEL